MVFFIIIVPVSARKFRKIPAGSMIFIDEVVCSHGDMSLGECLNDGLKVHNCTLAESIGVICTSESPLLLLSADINYVYT